MPKIESIRPGDSLDATFGTYPLADLLLGILRGNLTGCLEVFLHPEPRNAVLFRDGVPIAVQLPDGPLSLIQLLTREGRIPPSHGVELLRLAEASGQSVSALLRAKRVLPQVELHEAEVRWARLQLVHLFDAGPVDFRFTEGVRPDESTGLTILQPLPVVYQGLLEARDRTVVQRFLAQHAESRFTLAATYPHDVDPFEWGTSVENAVARLKNPAGVADLERAGLASDCATAVLTALHLTDMVDLREPGRPRLSPYPNAEGAPGTSDRPANRRPADFDPVSRASTERQPTPPDGAREGGLVIKRRGDGQVEPVASVLPSRALPAPTASPSRGVPVAPMPPSRGLPAPTPSSRPSADTDPSRSGISVGQSPSGTSVGQSRSGISVGQSPSGTSVGQSRSGISVGPSGSGISVDRSGISVTVGGTAHDREYVAVRDRLTPLLGQNYFQLLRVTADTDAAQLDRAYRFLIRRLEEEGDRPGAMPLLDLIHEAYEVFVMPIGPEGTRAWWSGAKNIRRSIGSGAPSRQRPRWTARFGRWAQDEPVKRRFF